MKIEFYFYAFFYVHYKFMENGKNCKNINFPIVFQDVENHKMEFYFLAVLCFHFSQYFMICFQFLS